MQTDQDNADGSLRDQIEFIVERTQALHEFVERNISGVLVGQQQKSDSEEAISATYFRMILNLGDMCLATDGKRFQMACGGARSMFEHLLDIKRLESTPTSAESFWDFTKVKRFDIAALTRRNEMNRLCWLVGSRKSAVCRSSVTHSESTAA